jgi:hypothetical protein
MRRAITIVAVCTVIGLASIPAWGDNPKYQRAIASIDTNLCYNVAIKETGLGNSGLEEVTYLLTCSANFTVGCFTKNGNQVQGTPKSGTSTAASATTLDIRNGQTTGTVSLCPDAFDLPDPGCTGNQEERTLTASYSNCNLDDQLGPPSTPSPSLPNLSFPPSP